MSNPDGLALRAKLALTQTSSLGDLVKAKKLEKETFLLIDCSYSMNETIAVPYGRTTTKMDALRQVVEQLRLEGVVRPMVGFGLMGNGHDGVGFIEYIPQPQGGTPLAEGIDFSTSAGATHLIVVSDGEPNDGPRALGAAKRFGGKIDVFYCGSLPSRGEEFLRSLAAQSGGQCENVSLGVPKQLTSALKGLLGAKAA